MVFAVVWHRCYLQIHLHHRRCSRNACPRHLSPVSRNLSRDHYSHLSDKVKLGSDNVNYVTIKSGRVKFGRLSDRRLELGFSYDQDRVGWLDYMDLRRLQYVRVTMTMTMTMGVLDHDDDVCCCYCYW